MNRILKNTCMTGMVAWSISASVHAQTYSIDWHSIGGGSGTSIGGGYSVNGTIGQPGAGGPMTGGTFGVGGGFWVLPVAAQSLDKPTLAIVRLAAGQARLSWAPNTLGFVLQESSSLAPATWVNSTSSAANPVTVPATLPSKFYRLSKP